MSGTLSAITGGFRAAETGIGAVVDGARTVGALFQVGDGLGALGVPTDFFDQLQPAKWRGVGFEVIGSRVRAGRRKAIHEYPFRDGVWVEDLGKRGRIYGFQGYVIGDDVASRIKALVAAAEQAGPGELIHPTFGSTQVEIIDFDAGDEWDAGGVWRFRAEFLEPVARGLQLQPTTLPVTQGAVRDAAGDAEAATSASFGDRIAAGIGSGLSGIRQAVAAVTPYVATATRLVADAGRLAGAVRSLSGNFGRYASGRGASGSTVQNTLRTARQVEGAVQGALATAATARQAVTQAGAALSGLVGL